MKCVWDFLNRQKEPEPTNYQEWMYRALGRSFADTFLIPYSEKFWSVHPSEMTFEWTGGKVPEPSLWQVFRGAILSKQTNVGANVDFRYPIISAGYGAIATAMKKKTAEINYKHKATTINTDKKSIVFENNKEITYSTLLSSIPLPELVRICPTAPDNVKEAVSKLRTNSIMVVNLGINRPKISDKHWVHFPEQDVSFFRISYPHNFADNVTPAGMSSITAEVSYSRDDPPNEEELIKQVIKDLIRVKALDADAPVVLKTTKDIPYAYCVYDKQREASLEVIHNWMQSVDILPIGRYGEWTYYWSDEAILSGKHAADKLQELSKTT
jgi:UDP-galactopyranose mutase